MLFTECMQNISSDSAICKRSKLVQIPSAHLFSRLRTSQFFILKKHQSGRIRRVPATLRGNKAYAWYQGERMDQIQEEINKAAKIDGDYTNVLFLTLTHEYDKTNIDSIRESWKVVPARLTKFMRKVKAILPVVHYVAVLEAHEGGGCHSHVVLVLRDPVHCRKDEGGNLRLPDNYRDLIRNLWTENVDVKGSYSPDVAGYLTKELGKVNHVEDAIKRARLGQDTASDRKKIWAYYWGDVLGIRLLRVSRSLPPAYEMEGEEADDRLDNTRNNSTEDPVIQTITVTRKQVKNWDWFEPWTGEVFPGSEEYEKISQIFEDCAPSGLGL